MTSSTICSHHRIRTVLLMCVVLLSASLHAQAQNKETRINLNIRNATLESFVKQLENATGFSFIYVWGRSKAHAPHHTGDETKEHQ